MTGQEAVCSVCIVVSRMPAVNAPIELKRFPQVVSAVMWRTKAGELRLKLLPFNQWIRSSVDAMRMESIIRSQPIVYVCVCSIRSSP